MKHIWNVIKSKRTLQEFSKQYVLIGFKITDMISLWREFSNYIKKCINETNDFLNYNGHNSIKKMIIGIGLMKPFFYFIRAQLQLFFNKVISGENKTNDIIILWSEYNN